MEPFSHYGISNTTLSNGKSTYTVTKKKCLRCKIGYGISFNGINCVACPNNANYCYFGENPGKLWTITPHFMIDDATLA